MLGALVFFQACVPLMQPGGKFIFMSSGASIIDRVPDKKDATYGITKVRPTRLPPRSRVSADLVRQSAMNYLARYAHFEEPELIIFSLSPGWVQT